MDEKTLLANIMIALDGYSQRISRLESALGEEQIAKKLTDIAESTEKKIDGMTTDLLDHMRRLNISTKLDEIATSIISHLQEFDVTLQMSEIDSKVDEIKTSIGGQYEYGTLAGTIEEIHSDVSTVRWGIDDIKSAADEAKSAAEDAKSAAEAAKSAAEDAKWAAESHST